MKKKETIDMSTGEITSEKMGKLNELIIHEHKRPDGSTSVAFDYSNCPTMAEQHTAHLTNINWLIDKYKPDELAAYLAARTQYRQEILNHNFAAEPNLQEAKNVIYKSKQEFEALPDDVRLHFANHLEFLKFIDNPANTEKMIKLGILTVKQIDAVKIPDAPNTQTIPPNQQPNVELNQTSKKT